MYEYILSIRFATLTLMKNNHFTSSEAIGGKLVSNKRLTFQSYCIFLSRMIIIQFGGHKTSMPQTI